MQKVSPIRYGIEDMSCVTDILLALQHQHEVGLFFVENSQDNLFVSYASLFEKAAALLSDFHAAGIVAGDEVILVEEDNQRFLVAFWACLLGKIVPVPVSVGIKDSHRLKLLKIWNELSRPYIFTRRDYLEKWITFVTEQSLSFEKYMPAERFADSEKQSSSAAATTADIIIAPSDTAFIQYSSGSTSAPKGVVLTHTNLIHNTFAIAEGMNATVEDIMLSWIPLTHDLGMIAFHLTATLLGCNQYIIPTSLFIRRPLIWMELAHRYKATISYSPNFGYQYFLDALTAKEDITWDLSSLRVILNGAEPILSAVCRNFTRELGVFKLPSNAINPSYGLAEASVGVTGYRSNTPLKEYYIPRTALQQHYQYLPELHTTPQQGYVSFVTTGLPIRYCNIRIADENDQELGLRTIGHIQIKGNNVTAGYYNKSLNTTLFTEDGWLRTGDMGFLDEASELVVTGREKNIIILQGQNYYHHDIEQLLFNIGNISLGKVVACADAGKGNEQEVFLVFVLYKKPVESFAALIKEINSRLADHLGVLPDHIIPVREIPKTTSGKIQHHALVEKYRNGDFTTLLAAIETHYNLRTRLHELWNEVLRNNTTDNQQHFFAAGGSSLLAMQLLSQIAVRFNKQITLKQLFENSSLEQLEQLLLEAPVQTTSLRITPATEGSPWPLSHQQFRFWTIEKLNGNGHMHHIFKAYRYSGQEPDGDLLEAAVHELLRRHEVLNTIIVEHDGEPQQQLMRPSPDRPFFFRHDITADTGEVIQSLLSKPFLLEEGPLFAVHLLREEEGGGVLLFLMHHIIGDGWSAQVILNDLVNIYAAGKAGTVPTLPQLAVQYKDYAVWQRNALKDDSFIKASQLFWQQKLAGNLSRLSLPSFRERPAQPSFRGEVILQALPATISGSVLEFSATHGVSVFNVLLALTNVLFHKYSGLNDILIGTSVNGRITGTLLPQVGLYINIVPLRTEVDDSRSFLDLIKTISRELPEVLDHQAFPFDMIVECAGVNASAAGRVPLFDILVEYQAYDHESATVLYQDDSAATTLTPFEIHNGTAQLDLNLEFIQVGETLYMRHCYSTDIYTAEDIRRFITHFEKISADLLSAPEVPVSNALLMTAADHQWLNALNDTDRPFKLQQTADYLLDETVQRFPDKAAVICGQRTVTYQQLFDAATQLSTLINVYDTTKKYHIVAILMDRSPEFISAIYGVWKAGQAYVPIHPSLPEDRIDFMLQDAGAAVLITEEKYLPIAEWLAARRNNLQIIIADEKDGYRFQEGSVIQPVSAAAIPKKVDTLAYVIYTSGSTGNPKGAMVEHQGMLNHIFAKIGDLHMDASSIVAQNASQSFDISVWQFFAALITGGTVVVYTQELILDVPAFISAIGKDHITILEVVPSYLSVMLDEIENMEAGETFVALAWLMVTGETVKQRLLARWFQTFEVPVVNAYGPTEASDDITHHIMHSLPETLIVPIGKVLPNFKIYVVDKTGHLCPVGVSGEIWVSGIGVGKGYLNDPVKTAAAFATDPFRSGPSARLYKTGDIGRYLPDGAIEFLGRKDQQVKIRGNRIELEEIEAHLTRLDSVKEAVVMVREDQREAYLVAFITATGTVVLDTLQLLHLLAAKIPEYMLPAWIMVLEQLPLTPNGKIDRLSLADVLPCESSTKIWKQPATVTEIALANIWQEILAKEAVAADDHFFLLGGQSLKATRVVSQVYRRLQTKISVKDVFAFPVLEELAKIIDSISEKQYVPIVSVKKSSTSTYPVSNAQKRLWLIDQLEEDLVAYNAYATYELQGAMDVPSLERAVETVVTQHEILRTTFELKDGEPVQRVHDYAALPISLECFDYRDGSKSREEVIDGLKQTANTAMDLLHGPLFKAVVCLMPDDTCFFFCMMHHIICDGWSNNLLILEVFEHYHLFSGNQAVPTTPSGIQYKDYAAWQQEQLKSPLFVAHKNYWQHIFADELPVLEMPVLKARPAVKTYNGRIAHHLFPAKQLAALNKLAQETNNSLFMVLQALIHVLLYKYTGQKDIVIGTMTSGRTHPDLDKQIGYFLNTVPLRNILNPETVFRQWLQTVAANTLEAFVHQDYPFDMLVNDLDIPRDMSRNPLFDVALILQNFEHDEASMLQSSLQQFRVTPVSPEVMQSMFDMDFEFQETPQGLALRLNYNTDIFEGEQMHALILHLGTLIDQVLQHPDQAIGHISILTENERQAYLERYTTKDYPLEQTYFHYLEKYAIQTPDKPAMIYKDTRLTYAQLNEQVNQLSRVISKTAVPKLEELIAVFMHRGERMAASILSIWKCGAAYLPLERKLPDNRIIAILREAGVKHILADRDCITPLLAEALTDQCIIHYTDELFAAAAQESGENYVVPLPPDPLAFVIFTSGSTGQPKGAMLEHTGKMNHAHNSAEYLEMDADTVLVQNASHGFDISVWQFFNAFVNGGTTVIYDDALVNDPEKFLQQLIADKATVLLVVPSYLSLLLDIITQDVARYPLSLRYLDCGGEIVKPSLVKRWFTCYPHIPIVNDYGPTEASDSSARNVLHPGMIFTDTVPIGIPLHNVRSYITDEFMNLVPDGVIGELCIGGINVGRGYLNNPEKTSAAFMEDPFADGRERLYKTGDRARYLPDGLLELHGRKDHQVKINGHRIELGEIEARLTQLPYVNEVVVLDKEDEKGRKYLAAFLVKAADDTITYTHIKELVARELPAYMIPGKFHFMDAIPLTINGKADRHLLAKIPLEQEEENIIFEAPADAMEHIVATAWEQVFKRQATNMCENFYQAGGDSITAIKLASHISHQGYKVEIRDILRYPSIRELAPFLRQVAQVAEQGAVTGIVPLTPVQQDFFQSAKINPHHFHQSVLIHAKAGFDYTAANVAWQKIQQWHDALRMTYAVEADTIVQYNKDEDETVALQEQQITGVNVKEQITAAAHTLAVAIHLSDGPLLQGVIFHTVEGDYLLMIIHHLVIDGVSWRILLEDFTTLYEQGLNGQPLLLPAKTAAFKQWAERLAAYASGEALAAEKVYWEEMVAGIPATHIVPAYLPGKINELLTERISLSAAYTQLLTTGVHKAFNTDINDILLTALAQATKDTFSVPAVGVMLESHGRAELWENISTDRTIGWFTSEYPVLLIVDDKADTSHQVKVIKEQLHQVPNKGVGYGLLHQYSRDQFTSRPDILFNYLGHVAEHPLGKAFEWLGNVAGCEEDQQNKQEYPVEISGIIKNGQLELAAVYHPASFDAATVNRWLDKYLACLERLIDYCAARSATELTPSDFSYSGLSLDELEELNNMLS
ncbi:amino acid adenylation domain-containing protein [Chitinophaga sp. 30R24]|uniref:non-ribosomal peptide synthetase n=1 Tax=Chitinophaga sp. 30R24 TaxID=3248838 RepID=UPI003B90BB9C